MKKIGITQRVDRVMDYDEKRDALDQRWAHLLLQIGMLPIPLSNCVNRVDDYIDELQLDGIVLSGGNDICDASRMENCAPERDEMEYQLLDRAISEGIPILAVCRGFQLINIHFGGKLELISGHVATHHEVILQTREYPSVPNRRRVNSYHQYGIKSKHLAGNLMSLYQDQQGWVEAAVDKKHKLLAMMWHPEREQPFQRSDINLIAGLFNETH